MYSQLFICLFIPDPPIAQSLFSLLSSDRYHLKNVQSVSDLIACIEENKEKIDCLVALDRPSLLPLFNQLYEQGILLPLLLLATESPTSSLDRTGESKENVSTHLEGATYLYHSAEVKLPATQGEQIQAAIDRAIAQFLHLGPSFSLSEHSAAPSLPTKAENQPGFLLLQQRRLAEKLKERLGYLGVYYKRNAQYFYRNLSQAEKAELVEELRSEYRTIVLTYFDRDSETNQAIDRFVNRAFFADISASQLLEIHMELMDEFAQQLKLEGRNEDILLDYRLVLIDILAHISEMYRRSIPREDIPFELLYQLD